MRKINLVWIFALLLISFVSADVPVFNTSDYVARYELNDNYNVNETGGVADSLSLNNGTLYGKTFNHGTPSGGVTIEDGAMVFNGVNGRVGTNYKQDINEFAVCTWAKANTGVTSGTIFSNTNDYSSLRWGSVVRFGGGQIIGSTQSNISNGAIITTGINIENWNHICLNRNYLNSTSLYVNGNLIGSQTISLILDDITFPVYNWFLGRGPVFNNKFLNGSLDEVLIFNESLSESEITSIYNAGKDSYSPVTDGLVAQYSGKDFAGTEATPTLIYDTNHLGASYQQNYSIDNPNFAYKGAMNFDGIGDFVNVTSTTDLSPTTFTLSAWVKINNQTLDNGGIISKQPGAGTSGYRLSIIQNTRVVRLACGDVSAKTILTPTGLNSNQWYNIIGVNDGTKGKIYINGVLVKEDTCGNSVANTNSLEIGKWTASNDYFNGSIADVRIYNRTLSEQEIEGIYDSTKDNYLHINANAVYTNFSIQNFTTTLNNSDSTTTTNYWTSYNTIANQTYLVKLDSSNYVIAQANKTTSDYNNYLNLDIYESNTINITFTEETTGSNLDGTNITIDFISADYTYRFTTNTSNLYVYGIEAGIYTIRYFADGYSIRQYSLDIEDRSYTEAELFLLSGESGELIGLTIIDEGGAPVEEALVKVLKYVVETNSYVTQQVLTTNSDGLVVFTGVLNEEYYKFIIEYPIGTTNTITNPSYLYSTTIEIKIDTGNDILVFYNLKNNVVYDFYYNDDTDNLHFTWNDPSSTTDRGCIQVYGIRGTAETLLRTSCSTGSANTLLSSLTNTTFPAYTLFRADSYLDINNKYEYFESVYVNFNPSTQDEVNYLFYIVLLTIPIFLMFLFSPAIAIMLLPAPLLTFSFLGLVPFGWYAILPIQIVFIILGGIVGFKE